MRKQTKRLLRGFAPMMVGFTTCVMVIFLSPLNLLPWLAAIWLLLFYLVLPCVSRFFAAQNCITFAIRLCILRGGKIVIREWVSGVPNFAADFGDRVVFICPPPWHPRMYLKDLKQTVNLKWEDV